MSESCVLPLSGCTPEPLMSYLKALGILRLVSEQADSNATACWRNDQFVLDSKFASEELIEFFQHNYRPTPIVVPWSGSDFFAVQRLEDGPRYRRTPTGSSIIEAFQASSGERLGGYRTAIEDALKSLKNANIKTKSDMEKNKPRYLSALRSCASDEVVAWIDSAAIVLDEFTPFSALLGSGGGSDGNAHFSDNFMQNLWEMLPDFDEQRSPACDATDHSSTLCRNALFGDPTTGLVKKRTSALYDSGAVGGPNATQGMNRDSLSNPWNVILLFEGSLGFAGAFTRRNTSALTMLGDRSAAFPFQFGHTVVHGDNTTDTERSGRELWLPIWSSQATWDEVRHLLSEARAEIGHESARHGVEMARAAASLGVNRGIKSFYRYAIVRGRVGGDNYNTAASLGCFEVTSHCGVDLFREFDRWLVRYRRAATKKQKSGYVLPGRFRSALRKIESAILDYCRYGRDQDLQAVLVGSGQAEYELALTDGRHRGKEICPPLSGLSPEWIAVTHDRRPEFDIALGLAGVYDRTRETKRNIGPIRCNLEPVVIRYRKASWIAADDQSERDEQSKRHVVWNSADLPTNMSAVLERRIMDGARAGCENLPLDFKHGLSLDTIASFIAGLLDDRRIEELLRGLVLIDHRQKYPGGLPPATVEDAPPLPREFALLKLLFLPRPLVRHWEDEYQRWNWRLARSVSGSNGKPKEEHGFTIRPEPRVLPLLRSGRVDEACRIAYQRLRSSGLKPLPGPTSSGLWRESDWEPDPSIDPRRLAASLLLPVGSAVVNRLIHLVTRQDTQPEIKSETLVAEGATQS